MACKEPITPVTGPSTPSFEQDCVLNDGEGKKQRKQGPKFAPD